MTKLLLWDKYRKIIKLYQKYIFKLFVIQEIESDLNDVNVDLISEQDDLVIAIINVIIELYGDSFFLQRNRRWLRISKIVEDNLFDNLKFFKSSGYTYDRVSYLFRELACIRSMRNEGDEYLSKTMEKTLEVMLTYAKKTKKLYSLWGVYVYANTHEYGDIFQRTERSIVKLIPDFERDNFVFLMGAGSSVEDVGIFQHLLGAKGEFKDVFLESDELYLHCCSILKKTDWPLEKYIICVRESLMPEKIIVEKIEERLFLLFGDIKREDRDRVINTIGKTFDFPGLIYHLLLMHAKRATYRSLGLRFYEHLAQKCEVRWAYNQFSNFTEGSRCYCENMLESLGFYFDATYLELKAKKERGEQVSHEEDVNLRSLNSETLKILIKYVWSDECRSDLKEVINSSTL